MADEMELVGSLDNVDFSLRGDKELVLAAVQRNGTALDYIDPDLKNDPEFLFLATANFPPSEMEYMKHAIAVNKETFFHPPSDVAEITEGMDSLGKFLIYAEYAIRTAPDLSEELDQSLDI